MVHKWLFDSGLMCLYSIFLLCCFFLAIFHKDWGFWYGFVSVILFSACIGYVHYNLNRTMKVCFLASILAVVLSFVPVAFLFQSPSRFMEASGSLYSQEYFWALIPFFIIILSVLSILGGIAGNFIAERTRKEEKD